MREEEQPDLSRPELYSELNVSETVKRGTSLSENLCSELSHLLPLNQSPSLVSTPYSWKSGNTYICTGQALKLLSIKHCIRICLDCMMLTGAGVHTKTLMPSSAECPNELLSRLPGLCQVIKRFCMYGTALYSLWRLPMSGQPEVHRNRCIQEHPQILIALGSFVLPVRKTNLFSLSEFVVSCKNSCWSHDCFLFMWVFYRSTLENNNGNQPLILLV